MPEIITRLILRHRILTLLATSALIFVSVFLLVRGGRLSTGTFRDLESDRAGRLVEDVTGHPDDMTFLVIFHAKNESTTPAELAQAMDTALAPVRNDARIAAVVTPEEAPSLVRARMVNDDAHTRVAYVTMKGEYADALESYAAVRSNISTDVAEVTCTGQLPFTHDLNQTLEHDLVRAELIALPLALLVLVLVFRTLVSASLPVGVGGLAVVGGIGIVFGLSHVTDIAMYTINVCSLIGLGVSIDYSLFLVSRYREELAATPQADRTQRDQAIVRAVATAGRAVAFSGLAVTVGLSGLLFFGGSYLLPMGIGGAIVVALAVLFALTFLPALLSLLGDRIHAGRVPLPSRGNEGKFWERTARTVMRRPLLIGIPTLGLLLAMGIPFLRLRLAAADVRVLDQTVEARRGYEILKRDLPALAQNRILVAVEFPTSPALSEDRARALADLTDRLAQLPNVESVDSLFSVPNVPKEQRLALLMNPPPQMAQMVAEGKALTVGDRVVTLSVVTNAVPESEEARDLVRAIRSDRAVADGQLYVGGTTARDVDATRFIVTRVPYAVGFVVAATLLILVVLLRSVLLPIKAVLMNFLSMTGSFGALVWIFQDGHLGVREPRPLEPTLPILLFCVLFGLSMDYEVLLLSRVREAYMRTGRNTDAVAEGLQKTAGLITSAAAIMVAVFIAFAFARVVMIQAVGVGMALAVALDATLVRSLLVPATMRLMGRFNWWFPKLPFIDDHHDTDDGSVDDPMAPSTTRV
ncbi:MAG: MMPL family transporter [Polyangiaceae bacterium]